MSLSPTRGNTDPGLPHTFGGLNLLSIISSRNMNGEALCRPIGSPARASSIRSHSTDRSPSVIAKYGGRFLARGGRFQIMEGPNEFNRFVVIEFPTFELGVECFQSPEI